MDIRVGTCGFSSEPHDYQRAFPVVELQDTLRRLPRLADARRWRAEAPDGFEFTLRAPAVITHPVRRRAAGRRADGEAFCDVPGVRRAWKSLLEIAQALDTTFIVFQTPGSFRAGEGNVANLLRFFQWAHRGRLRLGWEPLGGGWPDETVRRVCRELSLVHVVDPLERSSLRPRPPYFRLRGVGGHHGRYTEEQLDRLREQCTAAPTYCLFSNATMRVDAQRFLRCLHNGDGSG